MTPADHILRIAAWFISHMTKKYEIGQAEHGGRLWRKNTLKMLRDEIIDLPVYFEVLEKQHEEALELLGIVVSDIPEVYRTEHETRIVQAYNILKFGNPEGELEEDH